MNRVRRTRLASLLLGLLLAGRAGADIRHIPPYVEWVGAPPQAVAGEPIRGAIRVCSSRPGVVSDIHLADDGWSGRVLEPRAEWGLTAGRTEPVRVEITPSDPGRPLVVRFAVNGVEQSAALDLSPERLARARAPGRLVRPTGPEPPRLAPEAGRPRLKPAPKIEDGAWKRSPGLSPAGVSRTANRRDIVVTGRLAFQRPDAVVVGADGVTVRIFDENPILSWLLGETTTGTDGSFALIVDWNQELHLEEYPDLYIEFETRNDHFLTRSTFISPWGYTWRTGTVRDFEDFDYDLGTWTPADDAGALSVFTDLVRSWRWYDETLDIDLPQTIGIWPDNSGSVSFYVPFLREVHITTGASYNETTHAHEYGHGFMDWLGVWDPFDYCNGLCDGSGDCGHCMWCEEDWHIGWQEGFPNYLAYLQTSSYASRYGVAADVIRGAERIEGCSEDGGAYADPWSTEGFTQSLLQDIADAANDTDPNGLGQRDRLSLGDAAILSLVVNQRPHTLYQFINQLTATLSPAQRWDLWATAENNRIELDTMNPPAPTGLASASHPVGSTSPDATPTFTWTYPADDLSGPAGCEFSIEPTSSMTLVSGTTGYVTSFTTGIIVPGTWYFHLRTIDNSGKKSTGYATYGPFTIRAPDPINLQPTKPPMWAQSLVPRPTNDATETIVPAPTYLTGNASSTYWNVAGVVGGEQWASAGLDARLLVDGTATALTTWNTAMAPGVTYTKVNLGPVTVRGGRHTFGVLHDAGEEFAESSEHDNDTANQWIWSPYSLTSGTGVIRPAPPDRTGGWDALPPKYASHYNCEGFRFSGDAGGGWWQAVYVTAHGIEEDYDCRLHFATSSPDTGFAGLRAVSARPAGCLDAVLVNRNTVPSPTQWDVGVVNASGGTGNFTVRQVTCGFLYVGDSVQVSLPTGEMLLLREFYVAPEQVGPVSITARIVSGTGPVTLAWFDRTTTTAGLTQASGGATTEYMTTARLDLNLATAGFYALALYRDAKDGTGWVNLLLEIETTPPDFVPYAGTGWHSPLVPRPAFDGTVSSVPAPDTLYGNVASTYLNVGMRNASPGPSPGFEDRLYLDGTYIASLYYPAVGGWAWSLFNWDHAFTVPGGRHTLGSRLDPFALIEEIDEGDNVWGEQWVWSPYALTLDAPILRAAPPLRTGGWTEVTTPYTDLRYNCDGLRSPVFARSGEDGYWGAVAVAPGVASDVDLRLFELQRGTTAGFGTPRCVSAWGTAQTDFALVNFNQTSFRAFDAGVVRAAGSENYRAEAVRSIYHDTPFAGPLGPFTMAAQRMLHLHEFYLPAGHYTFTVTPAAGAVDWGVSVHSGDGDFFGKSGSPDGGCAWLGEASAPDRAWVTLPSGYHCVAVWKAMSGDVPVSGSYTLTAVPQSSDAPPAVPARTALVSASPNPFRSSTRVAFDLAVEADVALEVYDVHGARVAVLARGRRPAGAHQVAWAGRDAAGRDLPAGVYLLRLVAGELRSVRKAVKIE
jgi:hypothetical protein